MKWQTSWSTSGTKQNKRKKTVQIDWNTKRRKHKINTYFEWEITFNEESYRTLERSNGQIDLASKKVKSWKHASGQNI